ncbi:glutamate receptor ionotropic, kainate 3 [Caerostris darwini]|uniref:Glutamate receptor ionotropic, kainate 3 n=1 Tax=Caerostris darwini TaxID=1538125 RepID=A0AAV4X0E0_9ARAC|nr:glutamate receptor ionotropic, kainate 3 [Caerostris darwini]
MYLNRENKNYFLVNPLDNVLLCYFPACLQVSSGANAIFGPQDPLLGSHVQSLCDALDIPHIESRVDMEPEMKEFSINLHPSPKIVGSAIRDLIHYLNWTKVAILYEEDMSLISLQELIRPPVKRDLQVIFRKTSVDSFRDTLKDIRSRGIFSLVVDTRPQNLPHLLQAVRGCSFTLDVRKNFEYILERKEEFGKHVFRI